MDKQAREIDQALPGADVERVGEGIRLVLNENDLVLNENHLKCFQLQTIAFCCCPNKTLT